MTSPCTAVVAATSLAAVLGGLALPPAAAAVPGYCSAYESEALLAKNHPTGTGRRTVVIGDSYSLGVGLRNPTDGWATRIPGRVQVFGFGGSGYSTSASPCGARVAFAERTPEALATDPELVVVEGGLNDVGQPEALVRAGFRSVMALVGNRPTLVIGPARSPARAAGARRVDALLRAEAARAGKQYLSMVDEDYTYIGPRQLHIDLASHERYAARVTKALNGPTTTPGTPVPGPRDAPPTEQPQAAASPTPDVVTPVAVTRADDSSPATRIGILVAAGIAAAAAVGLLHSRRRRPAGGRRRATRR